MKLIFILGVLAGGIRASWGSEQPSVGYDLFSVAQGKWVAECQRLQDEPGAAQWIEQILEISKDGNRVKTVADIYAGNKCRTLIEKVDAEDQCESTSANSPNFELKCRRLVYKIFLMNKALARRFNREKKCGIQNWVSEQDIDVRGTDCDPGREDTEHLNIEKFSYDPSAKKLIRLPSMAKGQTFTFIAWSTWQRKGFKKP